MKDELKRHLHIYIATVFCCLFVWLVALQKMPHSVWSTTVYAQSSYTTTPIAFTGGSPGCTVLIAPSAGKQISVENGLLAIPSFGTGLAVQFVAVTGGAAGSACLANNTQTAESGVYVGGQAGSTTIPETLVPLVGNPAFVLPIGSGLAATVSAATGAQPVSGQIITIQQ